MEAIHDEGTIQFLSNDGPRGSVVCGAERENEEARKRQIEFGLGRILEPIGHVPK